MKINDRDVDVLKFYHHGSDLRLDRVCERYTPWALNNLVELDNPLKHATFEFQDLYEVEELIRTLEVFRDQCQKQYGTFMRSNGNEGYLRV